MRQELYPHDGFTIACNQSVGVTRCMGTCRHDGGGSWPTAATCPGPIGRRRYPACSKQASASEPETGMSPRSSECLMVISQRLVALIQTVLQGFAISSRALDCPLWPKGQCVYPVAVFYAAEFSHGHLLVTNPKKPFLRGENWQPDLCASPPQANGKFCLLSKFSLKEFPMDKIITS